MIIEIDYNTMIQNIKSLSKDNLNSKLIKQIEKRNLSLDLICEFCNKYNIKLDDFIKYKVK